MLNTGFAFSSSVRMLKYFSFHSIQYSRTSIFILVFLRVNAPRLLLQFFIPLINSSHQNAILLYSSLYSLLSNTNFFFFAAELRKKLILR